MWEFAKGQQLLIKDTDWIEIINFVDCNITQTEQEIEKNSAYVSCRCSYLNKLYELIHTWFQRYIFHSSFTRGIMASQRVESVNRIISSRITQYSKLCTLLEVIEGVNEIAKARYLESLNCLQSKTMSYVDKRIYLYDLNELLTLEAYALICEEADLSVQYGFNLLDNTLSKNGETIEKKLQYQVINK